MAKIEPIVKLWYDYLKENKIMGKKCKQCGAYEFPPVPVCNECSSTDMEWTEMSGYGTMETYTANPIVDPPFAFYGPQIQAVVRLDEGPTFTSWLVGIDFDKRDELFDKIPCRVKMEVQDRGEFSYPVFRIED